MPTNPHPATADIRFQHRTEVGWFGLCVRCSEELPCLVLDLATAYEELADRAQVVEAALTELVALKYLKEQHGETDDYLKRQPIAWKVAKALQDEPAPVAAEGAGKDGGE